VIRENNMKTQLKAGIMAALVAAAIGLTGCTGDYTGGGSLPSSSGVPGEKATFGFRVHFQNDGVSCDEVVGASGEFQYVDHGKGVNVAFHAKIRDFAGAFADPTFNVGPLCIGDYYVKGKVAGQVLVGTLDYGKEDGTDYIFVAVLDGPFAGYQNSGIFEKGNVTYHPDPLCE
jgi:hypothetical protein